MELEIHTYYDVRDAKNGGRALLRFKKASYAEYGDGGQWIHASDVGVKSVEIQRGRRVIAHYHEAPPRVFRLPDGLRVLTEAELALLVPAFVPWARANSSLWQGIDASSDIHVPPNALDEARTQARESWVAVARLLWRLGLREFPPQKLALPTRRSYLRLSEDAAWLWFWMSHDGHRAEGGAARAPLAWRGKKRSQLRRAPRS